ncbi:MAG: ATP-binding protein [Ruminococcus sp.]|nr:ATP-binding protein [Ruminococcus sp.]
MAYSKLVFDIATEKLNLRRNSALNMADYRKSEIHKAIPRIAEIERELSSFGISAAKAVLNGKDAVAELNSLKENNLALQNELKTLLTSNGYSEDYLEPHFVCDKCDDTGYIELDNKTITCECYKKLLSETACDELNKISPLSLSTFDSFNLDYYSETPDDKGRVPYKRMSQIYDYCLNYAKTFTDKSKSLLMKGETGLGKTHLSLAIANEVISKGYSVVYVSAPDILSKLEREHFSYSYSKEHEIMQSLLECDLLIIDDLGTEFITQFTSAAVYNLFNSRISSGKPVIINTNLGVKELEDIYSQRFVSRAKAACAVLDFLGTDIRFIK